MSNENISVSSLEVLQESIIKPRISTARGDYIKSILDRAQSKSRMIGIGDKEGSGKTTAVAEYYFNNKNVTYVKVGQSYSNKRIFHELIFLISGEKPVETTNLYTSMRILQSLLLQHKDQQKLIIIDDAAKLSSVGLGLFHELRDYTTSCTGIVFIALPIFQENLKKWKSTKQGIGEFYRRVQSWHEEEIPVLTKAEKISFCNLHELTDMELIDQFVNDCSTFSELEKLIEKFKEVQEMENNDQLLRHVGEAKRRKKKSKFDLDF
jgi:DNA transposition AAA+ family ATPase